MGNLRTEAAHLIIEDFNGVNTPYDELNLPDDLTPWSHGGFYNEKSEFERLKGKLLNSTGAGGSIFALHHLEFADREYLFVHQYSSWLLEDNLDNLISEPTREPISPMEPVLT